MVGLPFFHARVNGLNTFEVPSSFTFGRADFILLFFFKLTYNLIFYDLTLQRFKYHLSLELESLDPQRTEDRVA